MNTLKFNQIEFNHIGEQPSMPLQEKSVTIKENGTTEVVPDSGYALEKVKVKVNTPMRDIRYYKTTPDFITILKENTTSIYSFLTTFRVSSSMSTDGNNLIGSPSTNINTELVNAFEIDFSFKSGMPSVAMVKMETHLKDTKIGDTTLYDLITSLERITEKEYFS